MLYALGQCIHQGLATHNAEAFIATSGFKVHRPCLSTEILILASFTGPTKPHASSDTPHVCNKLTFMMI
jgi:hypothetical protein